MTDLTGSFPQTQLRRLRYHPMVRSLIRETTIERTRLVMPIFVRYGTKQQLPIASMPGLAQWSVDQLSYEIEEIANLNINAVLLFGIPAHKDTEGSSGFAADNVVAAAIRQIKQTHPHLLVIADVCFCEYTSHGHCGFVSDRTGQNDLDNEQTLPLLIKQALCFARAGADVIAPSGMVDGMVTTIRSALDAANFSHLPILSYAIKYASSLYGPFRDAAEGAPKFGNRKTYQMDPANINEALREAALDVQEGADMLMVKPAGFYLDVLSRVKQAFPQIPLCAYQVSGEYAMIKAAAQAGWLDESLVMQESLLAIRRAGADFIISYFAKDFARLYPGF